MWVAFLFLSMCISTFNYGAIPASERAALIAIYNNTGGDNWVAQANWKTAPLDADGFSMPGTEGDWYGVTVTDDHVTDIRLSGNNLKGSFPAAIANLSQLKTLYFNNNQLSGSIPAQVENLKKLTGLHLYGNSLSGNIPAALGNLSNLSVLLLNKNQLTGSIPSQLGKLTKLIGLYLSDNKLSGTIPVELGNLSLLRSINLSYNQLTGGIPTQFWNLRNLIILILSHNSLSGSIPTQIGNLSKLEDLRLASNKFDGSIPTSLTTLVKLYYLLLDHNQLSGEIPVAMKNLKNVAGLDIGYNCLTSSDSSLIAWLNKKDPDWNAHQGTCSTTLTMTLDRSSLVFGATPNGIATAPQPVFIDKNGSRALNWTATSNAAWLFVSPAAGIDSGTISISVNATGLVTGMYTGTVTVTSPDAANSPQHVSIQLQIYNQGATTVPFGEFSTPLNGAAMYNSIPVTGWVLDDLGVVAVKIYNNDAFIGDAVFVEGARPDVQAAYPTFPNNFKAGWGYMLLTHFLPGGGNGTYTISARAFDIEGNEVILGSSTISIDNAHAVKPFGAIDTPAQGGTISGKDFVNFGWALTPQPNAIPTNGATINVVVDGVIKGHPGYNVYRSDIATLFPGYANTNGAVGYFYLDTTTLSNGIHSISWNVTDNAGNSDGAGSRYFSIMNTSSSSVQTSKQASAQMEMNSRPLELTDLYTVEQIPSDTLPVSVQYGIGQKATPCPVDVTENGHYLIQINQLERVQINLNGQNPAAEKFSGYMLVGNQLGRLPVGSTLDSQNGVFYWLPGPAFVGDYPLVFIGVDTNGQYIKKNIVVKISARNDY